MGMMEDAASGDKFVEATGVKGLGHESLDGVAPNDIEYRNNVIKEFVDVYRCIDQLEKRVESLEEERNSKALEETE